MNLKVSATPNPFSSQLSVEIRSDGSAIAVIRLMSEKDTLVRIAGCSTEEGFAQITIGNLGRYAPGDYRLEIRSLSGELMESLSLVKN